jgi:uncharacterized iron-regulated membrane protein
MRIRFKRWLFLIHRWLGIAVCAFMAMWFVSGVVMMYVGYPKLTEAERLAHLPALQGADALLAPGQALAAAGVDQPLKDLRLSVASGARLVYIAEPETNAPAGRRAPPRGRDAIVIDAQSGQRLGAVDAALALRSASAYAGMGMSAGTAAARYEGTVTEDAFTHSRALDGHRPLHKVQLGDADGTVLYVSGRTGEVVRDATRTERLWNYAGAWIHWLYPFRGNVFDPYWTDIVNWLSIVCIAVAITGTVVGVMRWRFANRYRNGSRSPYAGSMMRWHHVSGLLFAAITLTWIFSGLMSMNPWRVFDVKAQAVRADVLQGGAWRPGADLAHPRDLLAAAGGDARELRWTRVLGQPAVVARTGTGATAVLDARTAQPAPPAREAVIAALPRLLDAPVARVETLTGYDLYYYSRDAHTMTGGGDKPLPILRVVFADEAHTWVHVDPATAAVLGRLDTGRRASRWLFAMLHSWDWLPLLTRRPLWDIALIVLSVGGTALSLTGIVIGWRRLRHKIGSAAWAMQRGH